MKAIVIVVAVAMSVDVMVMAVTVLVTMAMAMAMPMPMSPAIAALLIDSEAVLSARTAIADTMNFLVLVMVISRFMQREDRPAVIES